VLPAGSIMPMLSILALVCLAGAAPPAAAPFLVRDGNGVEHRPFADPATKAVVLVFVVPDCPVANGYAPEVRRIATEYGPRGVRLFLVHVDPDVTADAAARHAREYGYTCPVVLDAGHELVRRAGATRVPEAAVFTPDGTRKYRGRIDDLYLRPGKKRPEPTTRDLRDALAAVLAGKPVPRPETDAVGCDIPPPAKKGP
jgi:hypothetical protein